MSASEQGVAKSAGRYALIPRVLGFITNGDDVLLLKGAPTKRVWPGKYNGIGGHVERDEDVRAAMLREIHEETGLSVSGLRLRGVINIDTGETAGIGMFVFSARSAGREVTASAEGTPEWIPARRVTELALVEDLPTLLPKVLAMGDDDEPFWARYYYDREDKLVMEFSPQAQGSSRVR